eukprot:scaffold248467_cov38-Cyclotella_meneghiniana.AAC.4
MASSPVSVTPVTLFVPPRGRSNFFFSPKSRSRALGSSLSNKSQSFVASEEERLECMSVTSKPMRLRGHLHICSVVECSTLNARSKGRCLGRSLMILLYKGQNSFEYDNNCVSNAIAGSSFVVVRASEAMVAVGV